jgi:hypothetical protein
MEGHPASPDVGAPVAPKRRRTGLYLGLVAIVLIAAGGTLALVDLGFGPEAVHISSVDLEFAGASCDGWANTTAAGISGDVGSQVTIPIPLTDSAPAGSCVAENVTVAPSSFSVASANVPLTVAAGATGSLTIVVGLPQNSYSGPLTLIVGVSEGA